MTLHIRILAGQLNNAAGSHVYNRELATRLSERGHRVSLVFFGPDRPPPSVTETLEIQKGRFEDIQLLWRINPILRLLHCRRTLRSSGISRPDIVVGAEHLLLTAHHDLFPDTPWVYLPHSLTVSEEIKFYNLPRSLNLTTQTLYKHIQRWALENSTCALRFTEMGTKYLLAQYPHVRARPIAINPVGIATPSGQFAKRDNAEVRLLICGQLIPRKGVDIALDALALLTNLPWHLDIVGEGNSRRALEIQVNRLGLNSRVTFAGHQSNPSEWYAKSDLLLFPSRSESLGLVVLEAMSHATPCLAFHSDGVQFRNVNDEILCHGKNGLLAASIEDFSEQLRLILKHPQRLTDLGLAARLAVETHFSWKSHLDRYERLFDEIIDGRIESYRPYRQIQVAGK